MHTMRVGTRRQVWNGTAYMTTGGLTKDKLMKNKRGRIVSKRKHLLGKRLYKRPNGFRQYKKNKSEMAALRKKIKKK